MRYPSRWAYIPLKMGFNTGLKIPFKMRLKMGLKVGSR